MDDFKANTKMKSDLPCYKTGGLVNKMKHGGGVKNPMKHGGGVKNPMKKGGEVKEEKKVAKKAIGMHDKQLHGDKKTDLSKLKKGGEAKGERSMKKASGGMTSPKAAPSPMKKKPKVRPDVPALGAPAPAAGAASAVPSVTERPMKRTSPVGFGRRAGVALEPTAAPLPQMAAGGMPPPMGGAPDMGGGMPPMGGAVDPQQLMEMKKRMAMLAQQGGGAPGGLPGAGGTPPGGGAPMPPAPPPGGVPMMAEGGAIHVHVHRGS